MLPAKTAASPSQAQREQIPVKAEGNMGRDAVMRS
jgi:hypothetical protein